MKKHKKFKEEIQLSNVEDILIDANIVKQVCPICENSVGEVCLLVIHDNGTQIITVPIASSYIIRNKDTNSVLCFTKGYFYGC